MKASKGSSFILSTRGTLYQSYHQGWAKALENFDKNLKDYRYQGKRYYQLHQN